jgi:hypothetical protein
MIVKGILKTINYNDNSCTVRIPLFEGAATAGEVVLDAIFLSQPGTYNGYNEGDIVFVDFENDSLDSPIILGKVFLGAAVEKASAKKSGMSIASLEVSSNASLPIDTKLTSNSSSSIANVDKGINSYKSIVDIIKALHSTETNIEKLDKQSTEVIANIKIEYLSQEIILPEPNSSDEKWQTSTPEFRDGYAIWQKTTWHNHRGQILNTEIICLTELASSATYRLRCSTRTHYGDQQNEKITITAMVKLGSNFETEDTREGLSFTYS